MLVQVVAQGLAQIADMNAKNTLHHRDVRPDGRDELVLADGLACPAHERDQDVEGASSELHGRALTLESSRLWKEPEGPEGEKLAPGLIDTLGRLDGHVPAWWMLLSRKLHPPAPKRANRNAPKIDRIAPFCRRTGGGSTRFGHRSAGVLKVEPALVHVAQIARNHGKSRHDGGR
jgi:hypothetical protein